LWPLLVYKVALTTVESLERRISSYLRRWLGVPRSFSNVGLYSSGSRMQLPITALTEEFKATNASAVLTIRESQDQTIRDAGITVRTGRKWKAERAVKEAEARLKHQDIVGTTAQGRLGLGCVTRASWGTASTKERRELVLKEIRQQEEENKIEQAGSGGGHAEAGGLDAQGGSAKPEADLGRDVEDGGSESPLLAPLSVRCSTKSH